MKISVIWILSDNNEKNEITLQCFKEQFAGTEDNVQILAYKTPDVKGKVDILFDSQNVKIDEIKLKEHKSNAQVYAEAYDKITGDYVTVLNSGDTWSSGSYKTIRKYIEAYSKQSLFMMRKMMPTGKVGDFSRGKVTDAEILINFSNVHNVFPFYFGGTFVKTELLKKKKINFDYGLETERALMLSICQSAKEMVYCGNCEYNSSIEREGDDTFFADIYEIDYYTKSFTDFWIPYLTKIKKKSGMIPKFIQYNALFSIISRLKANWNNKNKHIIEDGTECLNNISEVVKLLDDEILSNAYKITEATTTDSQKWLFGMLKYGKDYKFNKTFFSGKVYFEGLSRVYNTIANLRTNIVFMNYQDGKLEIDGSVNPILMSMADEVFFTFANKKYKLDFNGRYAHSKVFGESIYKSHSFHVSIPIDGVVTDDKMLFCQANVGNEVITVRFSYESHTSRMSGRFKNSYWQFGHEQKYLMTKADDGLKISPVTNKAWKKQERKLEWEMFKSRKARAWLFIFIRKAYFMTRPFFKKKPIWMYIDKIYKGGDSSEYLFKYASAQDNNFRHYYLVDKKATDYKRLKEEGYKPLVRGTIKHRLVFLMADMMVISNSTVFTFNNFGMINSSYIRDLVDFHVCCVQHGMSVQKIAVAQNRLRDNTRLYFCASKYEIENLSKPIYDYQGYDALKLTGVPRYDGLVDNEQKQIMISPTWRMQAAVPVRTSESEQRDYNPLFKESPYFKVFNSLINDPRLIDAAKKYGYKIKYVLHPIVSSQVDDFDKNDYVDIIPAVGDMSYEKMFCESSLMVTDFSGIQFDFAYMRKPLLYLHHKDIPQHYEEGTFFYDTMGFGEICHDNDELIDMLCDYMANGCKMKEEYVKRADDFFYYNDHKNCERIYNTMIDYQNKYILH